MTPTSAAEKFVWSQTQCRSSDPLHSSSHGTRRAGHHRTDLHWEAGQPPAWGYNTHHPCSVLCEAGAPAASLFRLHCNSEPPGNHRVRMWAQLCTAFGESLASCSAPAGQDRSGRRLFIFAKGWETEWARLCPISQKYKAGLGGEGLVSFPLRNVTAESLSC